jgi:hypothetical protein
MSDPIINLTDVSTNDLKEELIRRAGKFIVTASGKITEAAKLLVREDFDAEGPLADAIQSLTAALKIVRDLKKESTRG